MNDIFLNRRSVRKFMNKKVEKEKIDNIIKIALTSPSGRNLKPWQLVVVDNKEIIEDLSNARPEAISFLKNAPIAITILFSDKESTTALEDASIIATFIQLAAELEGLKSCWGHAHNKVNLIGEDVELNIKKILNIPDDLHVLCTIGIGYGNENKKSHNIDNLHFEKVHYNKF